ncbi:arabinan endo-1,5-alpha-L-arabinosidase [Mangrovibacterium marinum]|nr:arabinan endo-1,5-alpha-L-arabinosidase [Mangrovibacterium marinum]
MRKSLFMASMALIVVAYSCKDDEVSSDLPVIEEEEQQDVLADYKGPVYADDYSAIASWENRSSWNLANVHDPSVVSDGKYYYMYGTDASYGNALEGHGHFPYKKSKDLVNWDFEGTAMAATPDWVKDTLNNMRTRVGLDPIADPVFGHWAPVVRKVGDKYRMYYSIVVDNFIGNGLPNTEANFDNTWTERAFIGMMETSSPLLNDWEDKGMVVCSVSDRGTDWSRSSTGDWSGYFKYNAIDPSLVVTPEGEHWLVYGSWHSGIAALQLNPETGLPLNEFDVNDESTWGTTIYTRNSSSRWQASEGPEIIYNEETDYYYLFLAYDELSVAYNTRVCRSRNITGPYEGFDGSAVIGKDCFPIITHPYAFNNHSGWVGISHCCVFQNEETGDWYYSSQGRLPANTNSNAYSNAIMMGHVRKIRWTEDGWPVVMPERYTAVPEKEITEDEFVGSWEQITLNYARGTQQSSVALSLSSDHKATGALTGTWSFDAANKVLTIGSLELCVERELDWEASPRELTIVFSGLNSSGVSIWGKKN